MRGRAPLLTRRFAADDGRYLSSTAVVMAELLKVAASTLLLDREQEGGGLQPFGARLKADLVDNWRDTAMLGVPGCLYLVQNNIIFIALSNLDAATYQVTYQLKILTTACASLPPRRPASGSPADPAVLRAPGCSP